jgi:hypothetical protein
MTNEETPKRLKTWAIFDNLNFVPPKPNKTFGRISPIELVDNLTIMKPHPSGLTTIDEEHVMEWVKKIREVKLKILLNTDLKRDPKLILNGSLNMSSVKYEEVSLSFEHLKTRKSKINAIYEFKIDYNKSFYERPNRKIQHQ